MLFFSFFFSFHILIQEGFDIQLSERMEFSVTIDPIMSALECRFQDESSARRRASSAALESVCVG